MRPKIFKRLRRAATLTMALLVAAAAGAEPQHGIAMYGRPALPPDFVSLPYVNPDAPKGGRIILAEPGGFDSLNPYILKGNAPWGLGLHTVETLMGRSIDEPFTLYGLLAESVETDEARTWVEFVLRPEARFSDGSPVTIEDVMWSYETLGTQGHPRYRTAWAKVAKMEQTGPRSVRFTFSAPDRELALLMGMRPILEKAQWQGKDFAATTLEPPVGSGPYVVAGFEPGRQITFRRNPDYWGRDLPFNRGQHNLDEIRYDYFADAGVIFQAFTAGVITSLRESSAAKWQTQYDFPSVASGEVVKAEIPNRRPSGITGLVMNTRNPIFADWRVREAMILAFNFEFINQTINLGTEPRITSYFSNSVLGTDHGPAAGRVAELLAPFAADLPPGTIEGYELPVGDAARAIDRKNLRQALKLFEEAGWTVQDGALKNPEGKPFDFEIVLASGATESQTVVDIYAEALKTIGITPRVTVVDSAQYTERTNSYAFDMAWYSRSFSLSPGNEQTLYWGSAGVTEPGTRNWMGMAVPAADAMVRNLVGAGDYDELIASTQALDRILTAGRYVIPVWFSDVSRIAHSSHLHYPETIPLYGDWPGFQPEVWWYED
ncbi:MAG: ABC transporter substrate-binding protein [Rhodobacteraceae bacterium]|jgi:peptide/nickel transport system substrate-binding protein|uniref:extracellular solute-binding protein n=1 Tax=Albidovulum sp. TaxID=1872424 RepID=UPI0026585F3E|nr:extracellular solute-binding protein [uncultured Defluviimonas sp.]MCC0068344.1 ABC transporter substrate-binding protein [Paracoccaceae bacterium]